jgi:hypothetical protein
LERRESVPYSFVPLLVLNGDGGWLGLGLGTTDGGVCEKIKAPRLGEEEEKTFPVNETERTRLPPILFYYPSASEGLIKAKGEGRKGDA